MTNHLLPFLPHQDSVSETSSRGPATNDSSDYDYNGDSPNKKNRIMQPSSSDQIQSVSPVPPSGKLDAKKAKQIASLVDARLASEFSARDAVLKEMQQTMSRMKMQIQIQTNNWRQFSQRHKSDNKVRKAKKNLSGKADPKSSVNGEINPQPPSARRGSAIARFDNYAFDPLLPRVAKISKKKPGELNELDLHRIAAANSVVRYAESRSAVYEPR